MLGKAVVIHSCNGSGIRIKPRVYTPARRTYSAVDKRLAFVVNNKPWVNLHKYSKSRAVRTGAERTVERKHCGSKFRNAYTVFITGKALRELQFFPADNVNCYQSA